MGDFWTGPRGERERESKRDGGEFVSYAGSMGNRGDTLGTIVSSLYI